MKLLCIAVTGACVLLSASDLAAQRRHQGFWIGFGLGGGANTSEGLDDSRRGGGAAYLRLGGTVSQQVLLGGEVIGWGRSDDGATVSRGNATFSVLVYPSRSGGFFLKGGVGGANVTVETEERGGRLTREESGFGGTVGAGFDIRLGRNIYLTPNIDWLFQAFDAGQNLASTNTLLLFTLGLTWH